MPVYDREATLARVQGDLGLLHEIVELFADEADALMVQIQRAVAFRDAQVLERAAHTLKGAVLNFGATPAFQAALRLEKMGETRQFADADQAILSLKWEIARLRDGLLRFANEAAA